MGGAFGLEIDVGDGFVDASAALGGPGRGTLVKRRQILHRNLRTATNTCDLTLHDPDVLRAIATADRDVGVRVTKNGERWFTGNLRDGFKAEYHAALRRAKLQAVDDSYGLADTITANIGPWSELAVSTTPPPAAGAIGEVGGIVGRLLELHGVARANLATVSIPHTVRRYAIDRAEDVRWRVALESLLDDFGYVFNVDRSGIWQMVDLFPESVNVTAQVGPGDLQWRSTLPQVTRSQQRYDVVRVEWHPHLTLQDQELFRLTEGATDALECDVAVPDGEWYPLGTDDSDVWSLYKTADGFELIAASGVILEHEAIGGLVLRTSQFGATRALVEWEAVGDGRLQRFEMRGTAVVRDTHRRNRRIAFVGADATSDRLEKMDTKWITARSWADRLASGRARWHREALLRVRFESEGREIGDHYLLDWPAGDLEDRLVRVVTLDEDEWGRQTVTVEGMPRGDA